MATRKIDGFMAAPDAVPDGGGCVYWTLSGDVDAAALHERLAERGLPERLFPKPPTPATAFRRALKILGERRVLVRPLDERGSYAIVRERAQDGELVHRQVWSARLDPVGRPVFSGDVNLADERAVCEAYYAALDTIGVPDVSHWLIDSVALRHCDGTPLRATGGFYYLPPDGLRGWRSVADALEGVSKHQLYELPMLRTESAVRAVLDGFESYAVNRAREVVIRLTEGKLGEKARATESDNVRELESKLARYENLLGAKLDAFRAQLEVLRAQLAADALEANADELVKLFGGPQ